MTTILHIDQNEEAQRFIQLALGEQYNLVTAADGHIAIQYCAMIQPDLILMDLALPEIEGPELAARLKMFMPQTPILIVAEGDLSEAERQVLKSGANGFLTKPIDVEELKHRLQALLSPPLEPPKVAASLPDKVVRQFETQIQALNQANNRLASLNAISALIGTSLDLEHLTDEILAQIHKTVDFDSATLFLLKGDMLEAAASRGLTGHLQGMNIYQKSGRNSAWRVVSHKLPLIIKDVKESEYWEPRPELLQIRSWLGVPLIYKDRVLGVLTLDKNEPHAFTDADARYVFTLAYQTAVAVENTQLFEEWEEQSTRLKLINEVTQEINTLLDVDQLFEALAKAIYERLDYDQVAILQTDETRSRVTLKAAYGEYLSSLEVGVYQQDINAGIIGETIQSGQSILINDVSASDGTLLIDGLEPRSALTVPLFVATQVEAVISVERNYLNGFNDQDLWTLNSLANHVATTIRNAWLYRSLDAYSDRLERTIVARTQRLQAIKKMSQVVSQGLDIDELLTVVGEGIGQIFASEAFDKIQVTIGLVDGSNLDLRIIYSFEKFEVNRPKDRVYQKATSTIHSLPKSLRLKVDSQQLLGQTIIHASPRIVNEINSHELYGDISGVPARLIKSLMMAPLITSGKTIGLIMVENHRYYTFDDSDLETLETLAFQVASAIEHARLLKKTREIAIVEERTRLARDMHDGVAQNLAYLLLQVDRCLNMVPEDSKLENQFEHISSLLKQNIDELRRNIFDLRPVALEGRSLFGVIENFVAEFGRRWNLEITCTIDGQEAEVSPEVESSLYRILQEALSNARQHAHCTQLWVNLAVKDNRWVMLQVKDDGHGFDVSQVKEKRGRGKRRGLGLISMRERVENVRGELTIESTEGEGTQVLAVLPLENHILNGQERS